MALHAYHASVNQAFIFVNHAFNHLPFGKVGITKRYSQLAKWGWSAATCHKSDHRGHEAAMATTKTMMTMMMMMTMMTMMHG
jgi:hypothetical protein